MNEQLQNTVDSIIQGAVQKASEGAEFFKGEVPELVTQLLRWNLIFDIMSAALVLAALGIAYKAAFKWTDQRLAYGMTSRTKVAAILMGGAASLFEVPIFFISIFDAIKIVVAPKAWLLEYAAHLIKGI